MMAMMVMMAMVTGRRVDNPDQDDWIEYLGAVENEYTEVRFSGT